MVDGGIFKGHTSIIGRVHKRLATGSTDGFDNNGETTSQQEN